MNKKAADRRITKFRLILILAALLVVAVGAWAFSYRLFLRMGTSYKWGIDPNPGLGKVIYILPIGVIDQGMLNDLKGFLSSDFRHPVEILPAERIPDLPYGREDQVKADLLRDWIKSRKGLPKDTFRLLAITSEDIYAEGYNFIFGQADMGGLVSLISVYRINPVADGGSAINPGNPGNRNLYEERLIKLVRHELGHTFGLPHCQDNNCVMRFHESLDALDRGDDSYCSKCLDLINQRNPGLRQN